MSSISDDDISVKQSDHIVDGVLVRLCLYLCFSGLALCLLSLGPIGTGLLGLTLFIVGFGLLAGGFGSLVLVADVTGILFTLRRLREDRSGLAYQLMMFVIGLGIFSFIWFALGWPADILYNFFSDFYVFTGLEGTAVFFVRGLIRWLPAIIFFILLLDLWVSAHRRTEGYY
jgi:hypothetical protein